MILIRLSITYAIASILSTVSGAGQLEERSPYYGGFALPGTVDSGAVNGCPADTLTCSDADGIWIHCCPNFTFCGPYQAGAYCCPTSDDCNAVVNAQPTCADPAWTLYEDAFIWCCTNDTIGVASGDGDCLPKGASYSYEATPLTQGNAAEPPKSWAGGVVPSGLSSSSPAAAATTKEGGTGSSSSSAGSVPTQTGSSSAAPSPSTKPSQGTNLGFSLAIGGMMFVGTLLAAVLL